MQAVYSIDGLRRSSDNAFSKLLCRKLGIQPKYPARDKDVSSFGWDEHGDYQLCLSCAADCYAAASRMPLIDFREERHPRFADKFYIVTDGDGSGIGRAADVRD